MALQSIPRMPATKAKIQEGITLQQVPKSKSVITIPMAQAISLRGLALEWESTLLIAIEAPI
jgi:hypothetical protein